MRAHWRAGRRRGLALLAALSMVLVSAPGSGAEEVEGTKNLSTPVILVDDDAQSALFNEVTVPNKPTGDADYTATGDIAGNYYTSVGSDTYSSTIDTDFNADTWGASWVYENTNPVGALAKWGDNLMTHQFNTGGPLRVEMNLFADATTAAAHADMQGYAMVSLEGTQKNELFGTLGNAAVMPPMVFTPKHTLTILKYDAATGRYTVPVYSGPMSVEVNASGNLIYGFNWGSSAGLTNPAGNYRLIFTLGTDSLVSFTGVKESDDTEGEAPLFQPMIFGTKISYLDIAVGAQASPIKPAIPFGAGVKNDFNADGNADVLARDTQGNLWLYPGSGTGGWLPRVKVGIGWNGMSAIVAPGDMNGDYYADVLARDTQGNLWLYPGNGGGGWFARVKVGVGWNGMTALVGGGDFSGDGKPDLLARDSAGNLWNYPGNGTGYWLPRVKVGVGWNSMTALVGAGDFSGDGKVDLLARDSLGKFWNYPGNGTNWWLPRVQIGVGWGSFTALVGPQDWNGDDKVDVMARTSTGQLLLYKGNGANYWLLPYTVVGIGWNGMTAIVS